MRGRTNITGGGMNLNAETKEFTVASGKNVVAGDFVSYYTTVSEKVFSSSEFSTFDHAQIGDGMCLCINEKALYLLKQTENGIEVVSAYNDYSVFDFCVLSDGSVAVSVLGTPYIVRLRISNNGFQFVCSASGIPTDSIKASNGGCLAEHEGKLYFFNSFFEYVSQNKSHSMYVSPYIFDISKSTQLSYISGTASKNTYTIWERIDSGVTRLSKAMFVNNNLYIVSLVRGYLSTSNITGDIAELEIVANTLEYKESVGAFDGKQCPISFYDKYIFWTDGINIHLYNVMSGNEKAYRLDNFGFSSNVTETSKRTTKFSKVENGAVAIFFYGGSGKKYSQTAVFEINEAPGDVLLKSNIFNPSFTSYSNDIGVICIGDTINDIVYSNRSYSYVINYDKSAELLTEKENKSYVEPYTGGLAIGVAGQSGQSGQTIEVYVAKPST